MSKPCKRCGQVKNWSGDQPQCPFTSGDTFGENWNCGIIGKIRDLCALDYVYCEDQYYSTIKIDEVEDASGEFIGTALWVTWYKRRGATDAMWILDKYDAPRVPTFKELQLIADHYASKPLPTPPTDGE